MDRDLIASDDYKTLAVAHMTEAWKLAKDRIEVTQNRQKTQYNRCARPSTFAPGDRVFGYVLAARSGKAYKLAQPYHGPYRVITSSDSTVEACPVDQLNASSIHVALKCIRVCRAEIRMCSGPAGPSLTWRQQT